MSKSASGRIITTLIGGTTAWHLNLATLQAIMAERTCTDLGFDILDVAEAGLRGSD
jgi:hypothetical protein